MEDLSIRPGFNLHAAFRGHLSPVRRIAYNGNTKQFLSMDEHGLKAWSVNRDGSTRVQHDVQFPGYQQNFITTMVLSHELNLLFTACLDDNLRVYNERLRLKSCMPWSNGVVREMAFYEPRSLLVTAGSYGVKVWECLLDYEAFRTDKTSDMYDVPKIKDGSVLPWSFGKYQHVRLRHTLHVPGARLMGTSGAPSSASHSHSGGTGGAGGGSSLAADGDGGDSEVVNAPWCDRIHLHEPTAMVLAMFQGHVYGFDIMNGTCLSSYMNLYSQPVTSCVFVPESDLLYTTAMDTSAVLWRIPRGCEAQRFKQFGRTYAPMTWVIQDPDLKHVLTTSLDGSVTLWDMDTLVPVFKMKLSKTPVSTAFYQPNAFFLATDTEVKIFTVCHLFEAWMDCNSPVVSLRPLSYGLIQAEFADSSVRVLDAYDITRPDKAVITTMPQLSSQQLVASAVSLTAARLFALLADGTVHVWQLHLRRPPSFVTAWTHLTRESGVSLAFLDGSCVSAGPANRMGLPYDQPTGVTRDHLMMGTASGDCLLLEMSSGKISFRFPAYKHQPLQILAPDLDRGLLVTVSRNAIKIWSMLEVRCLHELHTSKPVSRLELLEGRAVAGTVSGSVHVVELASGASNAASGTVDHLDAVTGMGPSLHLQHVVTGSRDSHIKVFDRDKRFKRSIYLGAPVAAVAYLNDEGDILAGMGQRLVVIRVDKYDKVAGIKDSIYDELRGQGRAPRTLLRSWQCRLQRLTGAKPPLKIYAASAATDDADGDTHRRTPPLRRLQTTNMNASVALEQIIHGGGGSAVSGLGGASFLRPRSQGGAGLAAGGAGGAGPEGGSGRLGTAGGRPVSQGAVEGLRPATRDAPSRGASRSVQWLEHQPQPQEQGQGQPQERPSSGTGPSTQTPPTSQQQQQPHLPPHPPPPSSTGASLPPTRTSGTGSRASTPPHDSSQPTAATLAALAAAGAGTSGLPPGSRERGAEGAGEEPDASAVGVVKSEDEDEGRVIAREMYPLVYNFNLHKERMRIGRLIHGLPSIHQRRNAPPQQPGGAEGGGRPGSRPGSKESRGSKVSKESSKLPGSRDTSNRAAAATCGDAGTAAAAAGGAAAGGGGSGGGTGGAGGGTPLLMRLHSRRRDPAEADEPSEGEGSEENGSDDSDGEAHSSASASTTASEAEAPSVPGGLSAAFRRTLPVIASPSAFFDGHTPAETLPKPRKGTTSTATTTNKAASAGGKVSAAAAAATAAAVAAALGGADAATVAAALAALGPYGPGLDVVVPVGTGEGGKKKKKKKKRRRRRVEMTTDLAEQLKARLDYGVRAEVKAWEKHQTVQRLATATFLPRLGGVPAGPRGLPQGGGPASHGASASASAQPTDPGAAALDPSGGAGAGASPGSAGGGLLDHGGSTHGQANGHPSPLTTGQPGAMSFKAMMKGLGVRGNVGDIARMLEEPRKFVVAQDQGGPGPGQGTVGLGPVGLGGSSSSPPRSPTKSGGGPRGGTGGGTKPPHHVTRTVVMAGEGAGAAVAAAAAGTPAVSGGVAEGASGGAGLEGKAFRVGAIGGAGNFGMKAFLEQSRARGVS